MILIGQKEMDSGELAIRKRDEGDIGSMSIQDFIKVLNKEIEE